MNRYLITINGTEKFVGNYRTVADAAFGALRKYSYEKPQRGRTHREEPIAVEVCVFFKGTNRRSTTGCKRIA